MPDKKTDKATIVISRKAHAEMRACSALTHLSIRDIVIDAFEEWKRIHAKAAPPTMVEKMARNWLRSGAKMEVAP